MTDKLVRQIASLLRECSPEDISVGYCDLCSPDEASPSDGIIFDDETVAVIAMPTYIGKLPVPAIKALRDLDAGRATTVTAVSYGGRTYGNALYELRDIAEECGFTVIGAGAFAISYRAVRGSSRSSGPRMDTQALSQFGKAAAGKIMRLGGCEIDGLRIKPAPLDVRGRRPVHKISRLSPKAAAVAQSILETISIWRNSSEWFL